MLLSASFLRYPAVFAAGSLRQPLSVDLDDLVPGELRILEPIAASIDIATRVAYDACPIDHVIERGMGMPMNP